MNSSEQAKTLFTFHRPGGLGQISFEDTTMTGAFAQFYKAFPGHGAVLKGHEPSAVAEARHNAQRAELTAMGID
jgi:hypothetical protein